MSEKSSNASFDKIGSGDRLKISNISSSTVVPIPQATVDVISKYFSHVIKLFLSNSSNVSISDWFSQMSSCKKQTLQYKFTNLHPRTKAWESPKNKISSL